MIWGHRSIQSNGDGHFSISPSQPTCEHACNVYVRTCEHARNLYVRVHAHVHVYVRVDVLVTSLEIRAGAQWLAPSSPVTSVVE